MLHYNAQGSSKGPDYWLSTFQRLLSRKQRQKNKPTAIQELSLGQS